MELIISDADQSSILSLHQFQDFMQMFPSVSCIVVPICRWPSPFLPVTVCRVDMLDDIDALDVVPKGRDPGYPRLYVAVEVLSDG